METEMKIKVLGPNDPALGAVQAAIDMITNLDVEMEIIPWAEYRDVLMNSLQAELSPYQAVYVPGHVWIPELAASGMIENITPMMPSVSEEILSTYQQEDIIDVIREDSDFKGGQYMIPTFTDGHILFYHADFVDLGSEGEPVTVSPMDLKDLVSNLDLKEGMFALALKAHPSEILFDWLPYFLAAGGKLTDQNLQPTFADEAGIQALEMYCQLRAYCPPDTHEYGNEEIANVIKQGKAAVVATWGGQAGPIFLDKSSAHNEFYKAAVFPYAGGATWGIAIPTNQPEAAKLKALEIALRVNGPQVDVDIIEKAGSPIRESSYSPQANTNYMWLKAQREMLNRLHFIPKVPQFGAYLGALTEAIYKSFLGEAAPDAALKQAAENIHKALNNYSN